MRTKAYNSGCHYRKTPRVCGGAACLRNTRIAAETIYAYYHDCGMTEQQIIDNFPHALRAGDAAATVRFISEYPQEASD